MPREAKIFVSTLALAKMADIKTLLSDWCGFEIFIEGSEWRDRTTARKALESIANEITIPLTMHGPMYGVDLSASPGSDLQQKSFNSFQEAIELCTELGCRHLVVHSHDCVVLKEKKKGKQAAFVEAIQRLARIARDKDVLLLVENIGTERDATILFDEDEYVSLFSKFDTSLKIGAIVDVGHAHINRWDIPGVIRSLDTVLYAMHVHDNQGVSDDHLPMGMGNINFDEIFAAWLSLSNKPDIVLEYDPTPYATHDKIAKDIKSLKNVLMEVQKD